MAICKICKSRFKRGNIKLDNPMNKKINKEICNDCLEELDERKYGRKF